MTVWAFRKTVGRKEKLGEFEYIGFSAFWGIALIIFYNFAKASNLKISSGLLFNPIDIGFVLALAGMFFAWLVGLICNLFGWGR